MNETFSWLQRNWYGAGSLLAEFSFLIAGLWLAQKILKSMRASQDEFLSVLRLAISGELSERTMAHRPTPYVLAELPITGAAPALSVPEPSRLSKHLGDAWHGTVRWFKAPWGSGEVTQATPFRRVIRWLQAPVGS